MERINATGDEADPEYQERMRVKASELLRLEAEERKKQPLGDRITDEQYKQMQKDEHNRRLDAQIASLEAKKIKEEPKGTEGKSGEPGPS